MTADTVQPVQRKFGSFAVVAGGIILLAIAYNHSLAYLWSYWHREEYSHGYIIPPIAALIAWHRLTEVKPTPRPTWAGCLAIVFGSMLLAIGEMSTFNVAALYGLLISVSGLIWSVFGTETIITIAPALGYLVCAIPLPDFFYIGLSTKLQLVSSSFATFSLDALGIPVFQDGNVIDLGGYKLEVAEACNGLRYLFPLMSFGYLIAYLLKDVWWKRLIILLSTIPVTVLINSIRITLIGITVDRWGIGMAEGFIHSFEGWSIFLVCIAIIFSEVWILQRIGHRGYFRWDYLGLAHGRLFTFVRSPGPAGWAAFVLAVATVAEVFLVLPNSQVAPPPHIQLSTLPYNIADWHGTPGSLEPEIQQMLGFSDYFIADYRRESNELPVNFYIAYYSRQKVGSAAHSPANCIPGGGWQVTDHSVITLPASAPGGPGVQVNRLLITKGNLAQLVYYWFDQRGRDLTSEWDVKWDLLKDSLFMGRTDGSLIRLVTPLSASENASASTQQSADHRIQSFLSLMQGQLTGRL